MHHDVVGKELARFRLDVVDLLDVERLDRDDLLLAKIWALLPVPQRQRAQQFVRLLTAGETDQLRKPATLGSNADRDFVHVVPIGPRIGFVQTTRVNAQDREEQLEIFRPTLPDHRDSDAGILVLVLAADRDVPVGLEDALEVSADLVVEAVQRRLGTLMLTPRASRSQRSTKSRSASP